MTNEEVKVFLDNLKICINEHPVVADWLVEIANRKTEPMETTDYCKKCNHKGCENCVADGSNPYCVPSRYEPKDEPQKIYCPKCGSSDYIKDLEKDFGVKDDTFKYKCINCNTYIKDEPQAEVYDYKGNGKWERNE